MTYTVQGPDGQLHEVSSIRGFSREHGLDNANLYQVIMGSRRHHKGYTCPDSGYYRVYAGEPCRSRA